MKKILNILGLSALVLGFTACEIDNYDAPDATLKGRFIDKVTGELLETSQGTGNMTLRIKEISYAHGDESVVVTEQNLNVKQDGTFQNTKLFAGTYEMWPYESCCYESEQVMQTVELRSGHTTEIEFEVTPFFEVEWVDEPWQDEEGYICARFRFRCNPVPDASYTPAVPDKANLFISTSVKVGTNGDSRYMNNDITVTADDEENICTVKTKAPIDFTQTFWLRIGVKPVNDSTHGILDKYCFSTVKSIKAQGKN